MDKKEKKRLEVLRQKLEKSEKLLVAAQAQTDDPNEIVDLKKQIANYRTEIEELKKK